MRHWLDKFLGENKRDMLYTLKNIKKFTTKDVIDSIIGKPLFQIGDRMVFYYGKGVLVAYSPRCFKIEGIKRIEYGDKGYYATSIYHFADIEMLKRYFGINTFPSEDFESNSIHMIEDGVDYSKTFTDICQLRLEKIYEPHYRDGETRVLENGKMIVQNLFIMFGAYTLFFRGKSKKNKLSGFQYVLQE